MKQKDYLNKKEYNEWLKRLQTGIEIILKQNNANYTYDVNSDKQFTSHYEISDVPNIGNFRIGIEPYECAKYRGCRGVQVFAVYCKFATFLDNENKLPYGDQFNHYSGKYNFHTMWPEQETLIDAFLYALRSIFSLTKN